MYNVHIDVMDFSKTMGPVHSLEKVGECCPCVPPPTTLFYPLPWRWGTRLYKAEKPTHKTSSQVELMEISVIVADRASRDSAEEGRLTAGDKGR